jgi:hypothetical protein
MNMTYLKKILVLLVSIQVVPAAASISRLAQQTCSEGSVCAIVCSQGPDAGVYFADFAKIQSNGRVHRDIIERLGYTPDEQIRQRFIEVFEADRYSSDVLDGAMEHVKRTTLFTTDILPLFVKSTCEYEKLADYSPMKHAFVVDQLLYEKLNATDRAGFWTRLALLHVAGETEGASLSPKIPQLVSQIYYGSEEDHDRVKRFKTQPMTKSEKLENIRELLKVIVPQPNIDQDAESEKS